MAINGGTLNIENYGRYNEVVKRLFEDVGIDVERFAKTTRVTATSIAPWVSAMLTCSTKKPGVRTTLVRPAGSGGRGGAWPRLHRSNAVVDKAKKDLARIYDKTQPDYMPACHPMKRNSVSQDSYLDYLLNVAKVDKQATWFFTHFGEGNFCVGMDATPAYAGWIMGQPGFSGLNLDPAPLGVLEQQPGTMHGRQIEGGGRLFTSRMAMRPSPASWSAGSFPMRCRQTQEDSGAAK